MMPSDPRLLIVFNPAPPMPAWFDRSLLDLGPMREPWPLLVHYQPRRGVTWTPRDRFYWPDKPSPSDCTWIVPGSLELPQERKP